MLRAALLFWIGGGAWISLASGVDATLRGVSAVSDRGAWASGTKGVFLRTTDGGAHWSSAVAPGAEALDFATCRASTPAGPS